MFLSRNQCILGSGYPVALHTSVTVSPSLTTTGVWATLPMILGGTAIRKYHNDKAYKFHRYTCCEAITILRYGQLKINKLMQWCKWIHWLKYVLFDHRRNRKTHQLIYLALCFNYDQCQHSHFISFTCIILFSIYRMALCHSVN